MPSDDGIDGEITCDVPPLMVTPTPSQRVHENHMQYLVQDDTRQHDHAHRLNPCRVVVDALAIGCHGLRLGTLFET